MRIGTIRIGESRRYCDNCTTSRWDIFLVGGRAYCFKCAMNITNKKFFHCEQCFLGLDFDHNYTLWVCGICYLNLKNFRG